MKILHTSDWHLGKKTEGKDRISEQRSALNEICQIASENDVNIVLVCGDIFDTYTPSAEAEDLFYDSVTALSDGGKRLVAVIAGNHDDPSRLCAASGLAQRNAILISGGGDESFSFPDHCAVKLCSSGKGFVKVNINGEEAVLNFLSYPSDARLSQIASDKNYNDKITEYLKSGNEMFSDSTVNITLSHLFCIGAEPTGEEREIEAGGVKACGTHIFSKKCHYTALGHIHKHQKLKDNVYYSGSILQYSIAEKSEKSVIIADISCDGVSSITKHILKSGKKIVSFIAECYNDACDFLQSCNDYVYLTIRQNKPLMYNESKYLKTFDNLLGIELELSLENNGEKDFVSRKHLSDSELFTAYYEYSYGSKPSAELTNLFLEILND